MTDAANPAVVASEDYNSGPNTDAGTRCDYTRPRPCPDLKNETIAASTPIAGHRRCSCASPTPAARRR